MKQNIKTRLGLISAALAAWSGGAFCVQAAEGFTEEADGIYYYVNGEKLTNTWMTEEGERYYFGENGKLLTGIQVIDGEFCFFSPEGVYEEEATDELREAARPESDITPLLELIGEPAETENLGQGCWYGESGEESGEDGAWYYGSFVVYVYETEDITYYMGAGVPVAETSEIQSVTEAIVLERTTAGSSTEEKLKELFQYVEKEYSYARKIGFEDYSGWAEEYALEMIEETAGSCYHYAAFYGYLAKAAATDCEVRICLGTADGFEATSWQQHAWTEVRIDGEWYVYDTNMDKYGAESSLKYYRIPVGSDQYEELYRTEKTFEVFFADQSNAETEAETGSEAETESEIVSEAEAESEIVSEAETESEIVSEAEAESEIASEAETESETVSETGTEPESESETEIETGSEAETDAETVSETESDIETEPETGSEEESESEAGSEAETEPESESESELDTEIGLETETEPESESETELETEAGSETGTAPGFAAESETEPGTEIMEESIAETETESETGVETETETEGETGAETKSEIETETVTETESESETDTESESVTETETGIEAETGNETETETESELETEAETELAEAAQAGIEIESELETESEPGSELAEEGETGTETDSETEAESKTDIEEESETEAESETDTEEESETEAESETDEETEAARKVWMTEEVKVAEEGEQVLLLNNHSEIAFSEALLEDGTMTLTDADGTEHVFLEVDREDIREPHLVMYGSFLAVRYTSAGSGKAARLVEEGDEIIFDESRTESVTAAVNVRSGPGMDFDVIMVVQRGTQVTVTGETGKWFRISLADGRTGYVSKLYVIVEEELESSDQDGVSGETETETETEPEPESVIVERAGRYFRYERFTPSEASIIKVDGEPCYVGAGGIVSEGWKLLDGALYYSDADGRLKCSETYEGITFGADGAAVGDTNTRLKIRTMQIVGSITDDTMSRSQKLSACWSYVTRGNLSYAGKYPDLGASGWQRTLALDALTSGSGNCYGFACAFAALAEEVGYDPVVVCGRVVGSRDGAADGMTRHSWVMIDGCHYDPEAQWAGWASGIYGYGYYPVTHSVQGTVAF